MEEKWYELGMMHRKGFTVKVKEKSWTYEEACRLAEHHNPGWYVILELQRMPI